MEKDMGMGVYRQCSEKINYCNYAHGWSIRERLVDKPGTSGAIINGTLINESTCRCMPEEVQHSGTMLWSQ